MQLSHSFKYCFIVRILLSSLIAVFALSNTTHADPPPPVSIQIPQSAIEIEDYKELFTEANCNKTLQEFPFFNQYTFVEKTKFYQPDTSATNITIQDALKKTFPEAIQVFAACQCIDRGISDYKDALFTTPPSDPKTEVTEHQNHIKLLGIKDWIERNIITNLQTCQLFRQKTTQDSDPQTLSTCIIKHEKLTVEPFRTPHKISVKTFQNLDRNQNCTIDSSFEKCLQKIEVARQICDTSAVKESPLTGPVPKETGTGFDNKKIACNRLSNYVCSTAGVLNYINFDGDLQAGSMDTSKTLLKEEQTGLANFFRTPNNNQGAGSSNPALNTILYIINLMAGLSFLIAVAMLILGGFYLVMASGNSEMTDKGKKAIQNFILAIIFTLLSYSIVTIIQLLLYS